ncbi:MAG: SURF1 family protein [Pseudomonadota bacterium]|nr:SURF1 family protein [Pseudomonadota bacterium]
MAEGARSGPLSRPVLSLTVLLAFAGLVALGVWQFQRLQWKQALLAEIQTRQQRAPVPLSSAFHPGAEPAYVRVTTECAADGPDETLPVYSLLNGQVAWRILSLCVGPDWTIILDRGVLERAAGQVKRPQAPRLAPPRSLVAVSRPTTDSYRRAMEAKGWSEFATRTPGGESLYLAVEQETPPAPGVRPEPLPQQISNNHLGYAITWFGLAAALLGVYLAMLRRPRSPA